MRRTIVADKDLKVNRRCRTALRSASCIRGVSTADIVGVQPGGNCGRRVRLDHSERSRRRCLKQGGKGFHGFAAACAMPGCAAD